MNETPCRVAALALHPIKSCAAIAADSAVIAETGLEWDRQWMLVEDDGEMLTQRDEPRLALVSQTIKGGELVLRAPGMLALHIALDRVEAPRRVRVWDDEVAAFDMGAIAAQWFSDFTGRRLRLVRFDPDQRRLSSRDWTGAIEAENAFADAYPLLVTSTASLAELNRRLAARGAAPVAMPRFRPNIVLDGLEPFDEDHLGRIEIDADQGPVVIELVKPCVRCTVPNVDPATAATGTEPGDTLATFRADARVGGGVTFGMNAVIVQGLDREVRVGAAARASWRF